VREDEPWLGVVVGLVDKGHAGGACGWWLEGMVRCMGGRVERGKVF